MRKVGEKGMKLENRPIPERMEREIGDYAAHLRMELGRGANTVASYCGDVRQFAEFAASDGKRSLSEVDSDTLALWIGKVSKFAKSSTQSRKISALRSLALYFCDEGIWDKNLAALVARPKVRRSVPEVLSASETDRLITAADDETPESIRDRAMLELMYGSGLRVSELCSLKESDIDARERIVRVRGKGDKTRIVPVGDMALDAIDKYCRVRKELLKKRNAAELFVTRRGKKLSRKTFWHNIKKYAFAAGIEKNVKPHILRHSFATHLLQNGANLMSIREMLGHSDLSTTQIYTRLLNDDIQREYASKHPRSGMNVDIPGI